MPGISVLIDHHALAEPRTELRRLGIQRAESRRPRIHRLKQIHRLKLDEIIFREYSFFTPARSGALRGK
jgi:hypothetical protein